MVCRALLALLSTIALTVLAPASADTLIVEGLTGGTAAAAERPSRGQSMDKVATTWGQPNSKQNPIGDPPIARWEYSDFVVYFEYQHVIHAVQKH